MGRRNPWIVAGFAVVVFAAGAAASPSRRERACPRITSTGVTPVLAIHHVPSLTADRYDAVVRGLTNGRARLESLTDGGMEGLLFHAAGQGEDGFRVVDLWASQDAVERFPGGSGPAPARLSPNR